MKSVRSGRKPPKNTLNTTSGKHLSNALVTWYNRLINETSLTEKVGT